MMKKCAIVTGAASGIGRSVAETLARDGVRVVVADRDEEKGLAVAREISGHFVNVDLSKREACHHLVDAAMREFGRIDILVNNAGFQHVSPLEDFPEDKWDQMLSVMLTAPFLLTKYAWPHMKSQGWGRVVNISSIHGKVASPNKIGYTSAKHGLIGLTRAAALEGGAHGITVNALCPAYVRTPLVEGQIADQARAHKIPEDEVVEKILLKSAAIKKIIEPEEIANLVLFLCSDGGASVTGASWTIDCGWTAQ
ncbi:MAG: 3-hydroxybutyrate dehydrogenase [Lentisphaeria bacterium]|nr:3-hydroxybutyrate dehydrogenase [Lentisphaeria bacterium]